MRGEDSAGFGETTSWRQFSQPLGNLKLILLDKRYCFGTTIHSIGKVTDKREMGLVGLRPNGGPFRRCVS
jgi:hypothetical protein